MSGEIKKVCVIGAGTMGSGIAAQIANAGDQVLLLDIVTKEGDRNGVTQGALKRIEKSDPPLLMKPENIEHIQIGNIEDDLEKISDCDWIVEAIVERLDIKRNLYKSLMPHLKPNAMVSSNTSTIPISLLVEEMPASFQERFCITHFFNPVRYMRLLELVEGEKTAPEVMSVLADYNDRKLGKGVVQCADTPGFLGNRVGVFAMQAAIHEATNLGLDIEDADALFGRPMGIPKTGAFGLYDLIGVDLMADVVRSLRSILPQGDPFHAVGAENPLINSQIEKGFTGDKGKGGFYAVIDGEEKALDLASGNWRERKKQLPELAVSAEKQGISTLLKGDNKLSQFAWRVLVHILTYSSSLVPDVTQSPQDIDDAMKLGYNWVQGPFELIDAIGSEYVIDRLEKEGGHIPQFLRDAKGDKFYKLKGEELTVRQASGDYKPVKLPNGVVRFNFTRQTLKSINSNESASLFNLEGDIRLVEFHSKANALDEGSMAIVNQAANEPGNGIIIHNDAQHFSAGVNLERFLSMIEAKDWLGIDAFLIDFQNAVEKLLYCNAPVVGAPSGLSIGGGYEVLAHCDKVVAHSNCVLGLVETVVGVVPGGGGVKETYLRWYKRTGDWQKAAWKTFNQIGYGQTGTSPDLAADLAYFEPDRDQQVMNRDRLVESSLAAVKHMHSTYKPRDVPSFVLAGGEMYEKMVTFLNDGREKGWFFDHDVTVASEIAWIVTGGEGAEQTKQSESDMYAREREAFIRLAKTPQTHARIFGMLREGEVPRN